MSVGLNIKRRRCALKMSQQELADAMGYKTRSTIAKIESGENDVSQAKLRKFAAILNTTVEALISDSQGTVRLSAHPDLVVDKGHLNITVILAGGTNDNNRQNIPSQFINVNGKPILGYCMEIYQSHPAIDEIYVVCLKGWESIVSAYAKQYGITKLRAIIPGGESGMISLKKAVDYLEERCSPEDFVIIQEATRPMVSAETISKLLLACSEVGSATICHSMNEYVQFYQTEAGAEYVDRNAMIALQSPEAHRMQLIREVFEKNHNQHISESCLTMLMYRLGFRINFIKNNINNIKISREEDIAAFKALIGTM